MIMSLDEFGDPLVSQQPSRDPPDPDEVLCLLRTTALAPFTNEDWDCYAGTQSQYPSIGNCALGVLILDGDTVTIVDSDDRSEEFRYTLVRQED